MVRGEKGGMGAFGEKAKGGKGRNGNNINNINMMDKKRLGLGTIIDSSTRSSTRYIGYLVTYLAGYW